MQRQVHQDGRHVDGLSLASADLRQAWVGAIEAAVWLGTPKEVMAWLECYVRPIIGYEMVACGTGRFSDDSILANRLFFRGFPKAYLETLRRASGAIELPRHGTSGAAALNVIDPAIWNRQVLSSQVNEAPVNLGTTLVLARPDQSGYGGTYFLFAGLPTLPSTRDHYLMQLLGAHMHDALFRAVQHGQTRGVSPDGQVPLSRRENEVLQWLVAGRTTSEIASSTQRSAHTINNQVRAILRKLHANNRTEAIAIALDRGLVMSAEAAGPTRMTAAQARAHYAP